jgi:hypothetical protein
MQAGQIGQRAAFIEEDQAFGWDGRHVGPPGLPRLRELGLVLLAGAQALLFYA